MNGYQSRYARCNLTTIQGSDIIRVYATNSQDWREASITILAQYILSLLSPTMQISQYASPATGATVTVSNTKQNTRLILLPAGTIATLTIALDATPEDQQTLTVSSTQTVTALTISGGTTSGAPTTMGATTPFTLQYDAITLVWHRI